MQMTKLKPYENVQAAFRFLSPHEQGTEKSVCKRYGIQPLQLEKAVVNFKKGKFKRTKSWNPSWDHPDVIHHVVDSSVMVDIVKGCPKGSDIDLFMDADFDPINGLLHIKWTEEDRYTLCASLPYRILEIIRDSTLNDELYRESLEFASSQFFKDICSYFGLDAETLLIGALEITKADL